MYIIIFIIILFQLNTLIQGGDISLAKNGLFLPIKYPNPQLKEKSINNVHFYYPVNTDKAWNAPLPNSPVIDPNIVLRDSNNIAKGFKINKN